MKIKCVVHKSANMILQHIERTDSQTAVIVGLGHTIGIDESNNLTFSDPLFTPPKHNKAYGDYNVFMYYYTLEGNGIEDAGRELAEFINQNMSKYNRIILHGHSKSGLDFLVLAGTELLKRKVTVVAVSSPLRGTPVADLNAFGERLNALERFFYMKIFSDHNVDKDICPNSDFIKKLNLTAALKNHDCHIIVSKCGMSINPMDWLLWLIDVKWGIDGDGVVPYRSQITSTRILKVYEMVASHATSMQKSVKYIMQQI